MVRHVRQAFREVLQEVPWLEENTKKVAQEKVTPARV
jgi:predicted metalloendopeptidase